MVGSHGGCGSNGPLQGEARGSHHGYPLNGGVGYDIHGIYGSCMVAEPGLRDGPSVGIPGSGVCPRMEGNIVDNLRVNSSEGRRHGWSMNAQGRWQRDGDYFDEDPEE